MIELPLAQRAVRLGLTILASTLLLWGCDLGPSGPGPFIGSVQTAEGAPGSALMLITGEGLLRVEGTGGTLGWSGPVSGDPGEMRVLLVDPDPAGAMTFRLYVQDRAGPTPSFTVLQLADRQNEVFEPEDIQIRLER